MNSPTILGQDCIKLEFTINDNANLLVKCKDYSNNQLGEFNMGSIY